MGEGPEAIARRQIREPDLRRASPRDRTRCATRRRRGSPCSSTSKRTSSPGRDKPQRIELRRWDDPRRLQGHGLDANRLLLRAGEEAQVVAAEQVPAAMVPGRGRSQSGHQKHDRCNFVPPSAPEHEPTAQPRYGDGPPDGDRQRPIAIDDHPRSHGSQRNDQRIIAGNRRGFCLAPGIGSSHDRRRFQGSRHLCMIPIPAVSRYNRGRQNRSFCSRLRLAHQPEA